MKPTFITFVSGALIACCAVSSNAQDVPTSNSETKNKITIKMYDSDAIEAWANCAWTKLPETSANLLAFMDGRASIPANNGIPFANGKDALALRINAVCGADMPRGHRNPIGMIKIARDRIFRSSVPENPGTKDQKVKAYLCAHKRAGKYVMTETDLVKPKPKRRMPGLEADCFRINADGTLSDA
ncbi:MAG: hypothetical protein AAF687_11120 [Pseudomonadota bacterium]